MPPQLTVPTSSASPSGPVTATTETPADDFDRWLARLDGVHPEPFHAVERAEFVAALDELAEAIPSMSPAESAVGVMRVAGLLSRERDGHQFALVQPDHAWPMLPIQVYELTEGVVITAARAPYEDLVGSTVIAVGDHPIAEVLAALEPLVPRDGPATVPMFRPGYLLRTIVLRGLGLVPDDDGPIALTVDDGSGERTVELEPISQDQHVAWAGDFGVLRLPHLDGVGYLSPHDGPLTWEYLAADQTIYARETQVRPAGSVVAELGLRAQQPDVERVVLDLRQNPGGDNHNNAVLVDVLVDLEASRPDVPIVVLTDRVTFSAASNLATEIEQATDAVFVGEAMGGGLNFWDEVDFIDLDALPVPMMVGVSAQLLRASTGRPASHDRAGHPGSGQLGRSGRRARPSARLPRSRWSLSTCRPPDPYPWSGRDRPPHRASAVPRHRRRDRARRQAVRRRAHRPST